ncbi:MAG TPA: chemotaxis protein CheW, partial [Candidatus Eisenbacteria bacterium]|nr:chemotaxis protein CheW [Candidatus Eisenbacteria bacterium]
MESLQQFCTFFVKDEFFGVPVQQVQEVIRYQEMTRVPLVSHVIRGLINLRGQIVMAVDLRRRLGLEDRPESQLPLN